MKVFKAWKTGPKFSVSESHLRGKCGFYALATPWGGLLYGPGGFKLKLGMTGQRGFT